MKKLLIFIAIAILALFLSFIYLARLSPGAQKAWRNVENSEKVKIGMTADEVKKIMGLPDLTKKSYIEGADSVYYYDPPFMASNGIEIFIDNRGKVNRIYHYEGT